MTITLRTDLRALDAPAPLAQWAALWGATSAPFAPAWEGLAGPPGDANGDTYPTRPGDRSHPAAPSTVDVEASRPVVILAAPAVMAAMGDRPSELVTRWFAPGAIAAPVARGVDGREHTGVRSPRHTAPGGASVLGATRPESTAGEAGAGALVLYQDGGAWRPAIVGGAA